MQFVAELMQSSKLNQQTAQHAYSLHQIVPQESLEATSREKERKLNSSPHSDLAAGRMEQV